MSTAIAEPPPAVTETKPVETAVAEAAPTPAQQDAMVESILRPTVAKIGEAKPAPKVEAKTEAVKTEAKAEVKDVEKNWAELRAAREAAEKKASEHEARVKAITEEYETFKKNPVPKEVEERLTKSEQRALELQKELQTANLARDPEFQQKYSVPIEAAVKRMSAAFLAAGADQKEINAAVANWNEQQFSDWMEAMPPAQRLQAQAAYMRAVELDAQRQHELSNAEQGYQELQKNRATEQEQATKKYMDGLRAEKKAILDELNATQPIFKDDPALQEEVTTLIDKAAGLNGERLTPGTILRSMAQSQVLARHFQRVDKERGEAVAKVADLEAQVKLRDEQIAALSSSSPGINPTGAKEGVDADAIVNSILHPKIRT